MPILKIQEFFMHFGIERQFVLESPGSFYEASKIIDQFKALGKKQAIFVPICNETIEKTLNSIKA